MVLRLIYKPTGTHFVSYNFPKPLITVFHMYNNFLKLQHKLAKLWIVGILIKLYISQSENGWVFTKHHC